jgi:hypothetical protein
MRAITVLAASGAALGLCAMPTVAADNGLYVGASVGQSGFSEDEDVAGERVSFDANATGYKAIAGFRFLDWLAIEGNYVDLGSGDDNIAGQRVEFTADGISVSAVGFLPIGPVDLFARAGGINWNSEVEVPAADVRGGDKGTNFVYGAGAQFRIWSLSLRAEYERFDIGAADKVDMVSLGVTWTFL